VGEPAMGVALRKAFFVADDFQLDQASEDAL